MSLEKINKSQLDEILSSKAKTTRVFRKLAVRVHPDRCIESQKSTCHENFIFVQECKELLVKTRKPDFAFPSFGSRKVLKKAKKVLECPPYHSDKWVCLSDFECVKACPASNEECCDALGCDWRHGSCIEPTFGSFDSKKEICKAWGGDWDDDAEVCDRD